MMANTEQSDDREERIREAAYFLWLDEGSPEGQADLHWAAAEAVVAVQDEDASQAAPLTPRRRRSAAAE